MEELIEILKLNENELKIKLFDYLNNKKMSPVFEDGFIYAKGTIPILLVAHLDTVLDSPPKEIYYKKDEDVLFSTDGIGGDDRCGCYAIMKILEEYRPYILFTEQEEIGGIGAKKVIKELAKPDVKYIIEIDRRGNNDCVFYNCNNKDFIEYIENFGFISAIGKFSDISILGPVWNIATVNLSIGYYNEHTTNEYIKFNELKNNIIRIKNIIKLYQDAPYYEYRKQ